MADEEQKIFSLTEAERLRVQLEPILIEAMESRRKMAEVEDQLRDIAERISRAGGMLVRITKKQPRFAWSTTACSRASSPR